MDAVRSIFEYVDNGQYMDKHCNSYSAFQRLPNELPKNALLFNEHADNFVDKDIIEEIIEIIQNNFKIEQKNLPYLYIYLKRIYLINASLFKISTRMSCNFIGLNKSKTKDMIRYAVFFGIIQQLVNDNSDFVPAKMKSPSFKYPVTTKSKNENDCFSDLKNKCITLPIIIHLQKCPNGLVAQYLEGRIKTLNKDAFFKEIVEEWSIFFSITNVRMVNEHLQCLLKNEDAKFRAQFGNLCSSAKNNKFYKRYRTYSNNDGKPYKEYQKYKKKKSKKGLPIC